MRVPGFIGAGHLGLALSVDHDLAHAGHLGRGRQLRDLLDRDLVVSDLSRELVALLGRAQEPGFEELVSCDLGEGEQLGLVVIGLNSGYLGLGQLLFAGFQLGGQLVQLIGRLLEELVRHVCVLWEDYVTSSGLQPWP